MSSEKRPAAKPPSSKPTAIECRFCRTTDNVTVDLLKHGLAQKAEKCFYLSIETTDPLPKLICKRCEISLCEAYAFGEKARLAEKELRRKYAVEEGDYQNVEYLQDEVSFEYLTYESDPVGLALEKLKGASSIVIKKIACSTRQESVAMAELSAGLEKSPQKTDEDREAEVSQRKYRKNEGESVLYLSEPVPCICMCSKQFASRDELLKHKEECNEVKFVCRRCGEVFDCQVALKKHQQTHYKYSYKFNCPSCERIFKNTFDLDNHRAKEHGEEVEELGLTYRCCDHEFRTRKELHEHAKIHVEPTLLCAVCGKTSKNKHTLRLHVKTHEDYRPWVCQECGMAFKKKTLLYHHSQVHTGVKHFRCDQCPKEFGRKDALRNHHRKCHSSEAMVWSHHTGEKLGLSRKRVVAQDHSYEVDVGREEEVETNR